MPPLDVNNPHNYGEFLSGERQPILIVGSGLSYGIVPLISEIVSEKKEGIETKLGITAQPEEDDPYKWAQLVIDALVVKGSPRPRLRLAEALGILNEPKWTTCNALRGAEARHRVIARFARERLWETVCSLNWDTHIENALVRIGFEREQPRFPQPWLTEFRAIITNDDFRHSGKKNCFSILKPHGCVSALYLAKEAESSGNQDDAKKLSDRFKITYFDLNTKWDDQTDEWFLIRIKSELIRRPLVVAGWSISEPYLQEVLNVDLEGKILKSSPGELTIVDIGFNHQGHQKAAEVYGLDKVSVYAELETVAGGFDANNYFLWLQVRYALERLNENCPPNLEEYLSEVRQKFEEPRCKDPLLSWVDTFLPAWTRLCWRSEFVKHATFQPHMIPVELEDAYVPMYREGNHRPDLELATNILYLVHHLELLWDFEKFPGAIFCEETLHLVIPLPWEHEVQDLGALSGLMRLIAEKIGFVSKVSILPIPSDLGSLPDFELVNALKDKLAGQMRVVKFSKVENISDITVPANIPIGS